MKIIVGLETNSDFESKTFDLPSKSISKLPFGSRHLTAHERKT